MINNNMEETKQQDQDFVFVIRKLKQAVINLYTGLVEMVRFSMRNFMKIGLVVAVFIAVGLGLYFSKSAYYTSGMTVTHVRIGNDYCKELVNNLGTLIDGKENTELQLQLKLSPQVATKILKIEYSDLNEALSKRFMDSTNVIIPFKVVVNVLDKSILDTLQNHIVGYLESNPMALHLKTIDLNVINNTEQRVQHEIMQVDSLKDIVSASLVMKSGSGIVYGEPVDPVQVYRAAMDLFEKKMNLNKKQALMNSFEIAVPFNKSAKRADAGMLSYLVVSFLLGYFIALLIYYRK